MECIFCGEDIEGSVYAHLLLMCDRRPSDDNLDLIIGKVRKLHQKASEAKMQYWDYLEEELDFYSELYSEIASAGQSQTLVGLDSYQLDRDNKGNHQMQCPYCKSMVVGRYLNHVRNNCRSKPDPDTLTERIEMIMRLLSDMSNRNDRNTIISMSIREKKEMRYLAVALAEDGCHCETIELGILGWLAKCDALD